MSTWSSTTASLQSALLLPPTLLAILGIHILCPFYHELSSLGTLSLTHDSVWNNRRLDIALSTVLLLWSLAALRRRFLQYSTFSLDSARPLTSTLRNESMWKWPLNLCGAYLVLVWLAARCQDSKWSCLECILSGIVDLSDVETSQVVLSSHDW